MGLTVGAVSAQSESAWLHVRVEEGHKNSRVNVNLPIAVVDAALSAAPDSVGRHMAVNMGQHGHGLSLADLRKMWHELKTSGSTEIVSVQEENETVKVSQEKDHLLIRVDNPSEKKVVRVEAPVALVDALLSGEGDELNVRAAIAALGSIRGEVVRVQDRDSTVHIWVDDRNEGN
jgi:hypothetical protein